MNISLLDIERAIRANFILSKDGKKYLETDWYHEYHSSGAARMVFVGVALGFGFRMEEICDHLEMTLTEFNGKQRKFRELYDAGNSKTALLKKQDKNTGSYEQETAFSLELRIYRKTILVRNYLASLQRVALELY